ncbi:hypothetical protein HDU81_010909 [Chytriomyces hyalinus]|nr:hypothetical protein HDU81_010909 [Chytriomyces hyalinus]
MDPKDTTQAPANVRFRSQLPGCKSTFQALINENRTFVDKSLFIAEIMHCQALVPVILRPPQSGKSVNISMLESFFQLENCNANRSLFQDLLIAKAEPDLFEERGPFGRHPTI